MFGYCFQCYVPVSVVKSSRSLKLSLLHRVASGCSSACKSSPPSLSAWPAWRPLADANDLVSPVLCHCSLSTEKINLWKRRTQKPCAEKLRGIARNINSKQSMSPCLATVYMLCSCLGCEIYCNQVPRFGLTNKSLSSVPNMLMHVLDPKRTKYKRVTCMTISKDLLHPPAFFGRLTSQKVKQTTVKQANIFKKQNQIYK
jgi:hypothetical protein